MAQISLEQASKLNEGGGKYFKLKQDESKQVRFLWDRFEEIGNNWCFLVHEVESIDANGNKHFATVDCKRVDKNDKTIECKYCDGIVKKNGKLISQVSRIIIPLYNVDEDKIQYWKRSYDWLIKTLKPVLEEVTTPSIAGQVFKLKRTGTGLDTTYTPIIVPNAVDNRTKNDFGEIESPFDLGMIRRYDEEEQQNQSQQSTNYQPRRTTEVF